MYLASTVDHHSVVLRRGGNAQCVRLGFQIPPDADLSEFEKQVAALGIKTQRKKDPGPSISDVVTFADPKGTFDRNTASASLAFDRACGSPKSPAI